MTGRERLTAVLSKRPKDRLAWTTLVDNATLALLPEELRGKAWIVAEDMIPPEAWVESFFDVFFEMELTPEAYPLLGPDTVLLNMELHSDAVPEPTAMGLLALGLMMTSRRRRRAT